MSQGPGAPPGVPSTGLMSAARNRYVDFLRAVSILAVVCGHWLIAAPWTEAGRLRLDHLLALEPWTRWLTWGFQVMPVFFMVGGYANAASWDAARRDGRPFGAWLAGRSRRLHGPVVLLVAFWTLLAISARYAGIDPALIRIGSQAALVPIWFLSVYLLAVVLVPVTFAAWRRYGLASFGALALTAVAVDLLGLGAGVPLIRWSNYLFVWLAVHQLGYLWRSGRLRTVAHSLAWSAGGLIVLLGLVTVAGYPLSMVGVPGAEVSNTLPPTLAMLALGCFQGGLLLSFESPVRRWLSRTGPWTATLLVNSMIMTIYLWHLTALVLVIGLSASFGNAGLSLVPGSGAWWSSRPLWMAILVVVLYPFLLLFGRFERGAGGPPAAFPAWRGVVGTALACLGLAMLAYDGIGAESFPGVRVAVILLALSGSALAGAMPARRSEGHEKTADGTG